MSDPIAATAPEGAPRLPSRGAAALPQGLGRLLDRLRRAAHGLGARLRLGRRRPAVAADHHRWMAEIERLAREGALDAAFARFHDRFRDRPREHQLVLLRKLRAAGAPPNRYVALFLVDRLLETHPPGGQTHSDALYARLRLLRDMRKFEEALALADRIAADPAAQRRLQPWQRAAAETVAVYALQRMGRYEAAAARLEAAQAAWPTTALLEEGVRLHCLQDPERAVAMAERRGTAKLRRSAFFFYVAALERLGRFDAVEAAVRAEIERPRPRQAAALIRANAALRRGDRDAHEAFARQYFAQFRLRLPRLDLDGDSLPLTVGDYVVQGGGGEGPPTLTVIMTAWNAAAHLPRSVPSILAQSFADLELIIVDDASPDGGATLAAARDWAARDRRVRVIALPENVGTYRAKNAALQAARGRFVTCHDSDDFALSDRFAREVAALDADPDLMAVQSAWVRVTRGGRFVMMRWGAFLHENPASVMVRRGVFDAIGPFDGARTGADTEFRERLRLYFGARALGFIEQPLTLGLHRDDSLTTDGAGALDENLASPERAAYWSATADWHYACLRAGAIDADLPLRASRLPVFPGD